jgi:hypothetical protein
MRRRNNVRGASGIDFASRGPAVAPEKNRVVLGICASSADNSSRI